MKKIIFLNQLRGLASLSVVFVHIFLMYYVAQPTIHMITNAPIIKFDNLPFWTSILPYMSHIHLNFGPFGVGLFFLISGFVIAISIEKYGSKNFLIGRFFRLYPTYAIGLAISIGFLYLSSIYFNTSFDISLFSYIKTISLFGDLLKAPNIDFVVWTLNIEVKFYLLISFLYILNKEVLNLKSILALCIAMTLGNYYIHQQSPALVSFTTFIAPISYMFIGTIFYFHYKSHITTKIATFIITVLLSLAYLNVYIANQVMSLPPFSYLYALIVFSVSYFYRTKFRQNRFLDFFADISYTLYVTHSIVAYTIMNMLYVYINNTTVVMLITFLINIGIAYALHKFIEMPTHTLGQSLIQKNNGLPSS